MGEEGTLALLEAHAGVRLYVPRNPRGWTLVQRIGLEAATALCKAYGGADVLVPSVKAWRVVRYNAIGHSNADIARLVGLSERTIYRILARQEWYGANRVPGQKTLFPL